MRVSLGGRDVTPSAPKLREVLALLVLRENRLVSTGDLSEELWAATPPPSASVTLQTYIHRLRKLLFPAGASLPAGPSLHTGWRGYRLEIGTECVDTSQFESLAARGAIALDADKPWEAAELLRGALTLWRGAAMGDVEMGNLLTAHAARLEEGRVGALEARIEADLQLGRHRGVISELRELVIKLPLHEGFHRQLMMALYRGHRRDEALSLYRTFRDRLVDELALDPSPALQQLHRSLLTGALEDDPVPDVPADRLTATTPAQLPYDISDFVGRDRPLASVVRRLASGDGTAGALRMALVTGIPGVGKTAFAIRVAQALRPTFSGGQFYTTLGGSTGHPVDAAVVLGKFLRAAGFAEGRIPADLEDRAALFRSWSADRDVLVVLDDAVSEAQVEPLLPAGPRCAVVVTADRGLQGLAGAHLVALAPLPFDEGLELLATLIGRDRLAAERAEAARLVELCGGLPLAIRCVGARLRSASGWPVANMRRHLESSDRPLDLLQFNGLNVRARLANAYRSIPPQLQRAFRLLSMFEDGSFTAAAVAHQLHCSAKQADKLLAHLVGHGLLGISAVPDGVAHFQLHPVNRWYAAELLREEAGRAEPSPLGAPG
ncbi:BTAD domain-containing putative transcriptional regulator [Amycolatopsis sp. NPDC059027]|uniref:AfsR/SARP family transcriptional regulator n=1 Tax=Amycolatopsis sp. NPDC059027 TaxID=3346709 RepID=UPI00366E03BE